jgi:hypothetical protein
MSLFVVSRRKVVFHQPSMGTVQVVYVPSADQIQVLKDAAGTTLQVKSATSAATTRGPQMARVQRGQRTLYGTLPPEILDLRQAVKVWLAEDLVPTDAEAFFFIFSQQVVVHGIRERNDEGRLVWRTAQLQLPAGEAALPALNIILSDYSLANPGQNVCLAVVNEVGLYRALQQGQQAHGFIPVPFSTLKPAAEITPLYAHANFTWLYMLLVILGILLVSGVGIMWMAEAAKARALITQIDEVEAQIRAVQINKRTGHIRQPDAVLAEIRAGVAISPSALVQATAMLAQNLGDIQQIELAQANALDAESGITILPEWQPMKVIINNPLQTLLVDQAAATRDLLQAMPWVRQVVRQGQGGTGQLDLVMLLQVTGTVPPPAIAALPAAELATVSATSPSEVQP